MKKGTTSLPYRSSRDAIRRRNLWTRSPSAFARLSNCVLKLRARRNKPWSSSESSASPLRHEPDSACYGFGLARGARQGRLRRRSDGVLPITDRLHRRSAWRAKGPNIPHRRLTEEPAVFAVELAGAFVSNLKGRAGGVQTIHEHTSPRCLQPKLFLILKWTHGGERAEMVVQGGRAHACDFREIFNAQRLRVVRRDPGDRFRRPVALLSQRGNRPKACSLRTLKDSVDDLALNQATKKGNVPRRVQQVHEPAACTEEFHRGPTGRHARIVRRRLSHRNLLPVEKLSDHRHFEFERQGQAGHLFTCLDHAADDRQIDRRQQESGRIVDEDVSAEFYALSPLGDHGHARLVSRSEEHT